MPRRKMDPVISALLQKIPSPDGEWPEGERLLWMRQFLMATDLAWGGNASGSFKTDGAPTPAPISKPKHEPAHDFRIDKAGYIRNAQGERVLPGQALGTVLDERGINSDLATIIWADDSLGVHGADINVIIA